VPAAAVIPAPMVSMVDVAVKRSVVEIVVCLLLNLRLRFGRETD